jgi:hypothetical protein
VTPPIDTDFDVRTDSGGKDPDSHSATLRRYHRLLWSKPLPSGAMFELDDQLTHVSHLGEFRLASDAITHTYRQWNRPPALVEARDQVPQHEIDAFLRLGCTVGAYTVFPRRVRADGKWRLSINQARGLHPLIGDRFDLTLECIRRHYLGIDHPLAATLGWYREFFDLFGDFPGYVNFFLFQDLVTDDAESVQFLTEFDDFQRTPLPSRSAGEYREYMQRSMAFIRARNGRIERG